MIYDTAVIIPTTLSPVLQRSVRSVYEQDFPGTVQIMVGIDVVRGSKDILTRLEKECPKNMTLTVIDIGYSTSKRHGGIYANWSGGSLRTILSFAANSKYLAYLDDDNWWAPGHLSDLMDTIEGYAWAYSYRWYVNPFDDSPMCIDEWESVGPGKGYYKKRFNGFVDTNCLMMDKLQCHWVLPAWCIAKNKKGAGVDRVVFEKLQTQFESNCTGNATAYYVVREADVAVVKKFMERKGQGE